MSEGFISQKQSKKSRNFGRQPEPLQGAASRLTTYSAAALLLAAGLMPSAYAAGLGRLTVQSALGQPLQAEVEITALSREEADSLSVRMAPAAAFRQAGLEYNPVLRNLRLAIERRADGTPFIRLTSSQPVNEPFVDMMVELNWASGRFVREYTFLLDPPELRLAQPAPQEAQARIVAPAVPAPAAAAPSAETAAPPPASGEPSASAQAPAAAPASEAAAPSESASSPPATPAPSPSAGIRTVEVVRGDSLSAIAGEIRPEGVTLAQTMLAIYRANPDAFFGSMNKLKAGETLEIPDQGSIAAIDRGEAQREFRVALEEYRAYRERLAATVPTVQASASGRTAEGRIEPRASAPAAPAAPADRLELSRPSTDGAAGGAGTGASAAARTEEAEIAQRAALAEASSRVSDLERNVADLQQLLQLKDQQLAQLQQRLEAAESAARTASGAIAPAPSEAASAAAAGAAAGAAATAGSTTTPGEPLALRPSTTPAQVPAAAAPATSGAPSAPQTTSATTSPQATTAQAPAASAPAAPAQAPAAQAPAAATPAAPAQQPAATAPAPAVAPPAAKPAQPRAEPGIFDSVLENPILLPALGGLALLGAGYAWYAVRRRRREENFEDSLIATDAFSANSLFGSTGGQSVDTAAPGLTTHTSDSSMTIASTEVDPIAEAEVYIAYGREAQAEEILREALRKQPERQAVRLKLMEIYAGRKDIGAFNGLAEEMFEQSGASSDEWPKVISLGRRIDPDNPMYGGSGGGGDGAGGGAAREQTTDASAREPAGAAGGAGSAAISAAAGLAAGAAMASGGQSESDADAQSRSPGAQAVAEAEPTPFADTAPLSATGAAQVAEDDEDQLDALDFDLDVDTTVDKAAQRLNQEPEHELPAVDDAALDSLTMFEPEFEESEGSAQAPSAATAQASQAPAARVSEAPAMQASAAAGSMDFQVDLPSLDELGSPAGERAAAAAGEPPELDLSAISLDLGSPSAAAGGDGEAGSESNPRWQEMATKLDLASAYEEIGDKEGARELLDEVMRSGDAAQQARARELMEKIA